MPNIAKNWTNTDSEPRPTAESSREPTGSSGADSGVLRGTKRSVMAPPSGERRVEAEDRRPVNHSSNRPEASRPTSALPPATPAQIPTARSGASAEKVPVMIDSVVGMIIAAPRPMTARTAIRVPGSESCVATSAPRPKIARPASSTVRRPSRSSIAPAGRSSPANTRA